MKAGYNKLNMAKTLHYNVFICHFSNTPEIWCHLRILKRILNAAVYIQLSREPNSEFRYFSAQISKHSETVIQLKKNSVKFKQFRENKHIHFHSTASDICRLPKVPGPCYAYIPAFYFNSDSQKCEQFIYGGCEGNGNRFPTLQACNKVCAGKFLILHGRVWLAQLVRSLPSSHKVPVRSSDLPRFEYLCYLLFRLS